MKCAIFLDFFFSNWINIYFIRRNISQKYHLLYKLMEKLNSFTLFLSRSSSRIEFHSTSNGAIAAYCFASFICHYYLCYYWFRVVFGQIACHMLWQCDKWWDSFILCIRLRHTIFRLRSFDFSFALNKFTWHRNRWRSGSMQRWYRQWLPL